MEKNQIVVLFILMLGFLGINTLQAKEADTIKTKKEKLVKGKKKKDSLCWNAADKRIKAMEDKDIIASFKTRADFKSKLDDEAKKIITNFKDKDTFNQQLEKYKVEILNTYKKDEDALLSKKRKTIFTEFKETDRLRSELKSYTSPEYWLIVLIILVAGVIGGIARTNWSFLSEVGEELKKIQDQLEECKKKIPDANIGNATLQNAISNFTTNIDDLGKKIGIVDDNITSAIKDNNAKLNTRFASIIFGIIASSIAILALKLTESKILDFNQPIDYFVLWGWCILGAIYAKKWIENLYGKLTSLVKV